MTFHHTLLSLLRSSLPFQKVTGQNSEGLLTSKLFYLSLSQLVFLLYF